MEFVLEPCLNGSYHYVGRVSSYVNWFISYNPMTFYGHTETAIVFNKGYHRGKKEPHFAILEGDFREQYRNCKTLVEALQVYIGNYDKVSFFSDVSVEFAKEVIKKENKFKFLDRYVESFKALQGGSEEPCKLPYLVVYFRIALDKLGITDSDVPAFFKWSKYRAEDFWSWGHNSRWANTFCYQLYENTDKYVRKLKKEMEAQEIKDFDLVKELEG